MKKGFASMTIVYSFLLVFLLTLVSLLALYTQKARYADTIVTEGKKEILTISDIEISIPNIYVDSVRVNSLSGTEDYYLATNSTCSNGSVLEWNIASQELTVKGIGKKDSCTLYFDTEFKLTNADLGSYISYTGTNGCPTTEVTGSGAAQSADACSGKNANQNADTSNYTYGYCYSAAIKFYTYGWRLAYVYDSDSNSETEPYIISSGSPQCVTGTANNSTTTISNLNTAALKYCNVTYAFGGACSASTAWAFKDGDFQLLTNQFFETTKTASTCNNIYCTKECGYNNDILDNGSAYWVATAYSSTNTYSFSRYMYNISAAVAYGLRPVIHLKPNIYVTGGSGTINDPYQIQAK